MKTTAATPPHCESGTEGTRDLDLRGLSCPLPVLRTNQVLKAMAAGAVLCLHTSDPRTVTEIPELCRKTGHQCLEQTSGTDGYSFRIRRGT